MKHHVIALINRACNGGEQMHGHEINAEIILLYLSLNYPKHYHFLWFSAGISRLMYYSMNENLIETKYWILIGALLK